MSADQVAIGSYNLGKAHVFNRDSNTDTWTETVALSNPSSNAQSYFGSSTALSAAGDVLVVGAMGDDVAYVYNKDDTGAWSLSQSLEPADEATGKFGYALSISGEYIAVGAYEDGAGSAYIFGKDATGATGASWAQIEKLTASDGVSGYRFGYAVDIVSDASTGSVTVAVGSDYDKTEDVDGSPHGSVYVFGKESGGAFVQTAKLLADDRARADYLGESVKISPSGDYVLAGAIGADVGGAAYVFMRDSDGVWAQTNKLVPSDGARYDFFGTSLAMSDEFVIVGSPSRDTVDLRENGAVYVFSGVVVEQATNAPTTDTSGPSLAPSSAPTDATSGPTASTVEPTIATSAPSLSPSSPPTDATLAPSLSPSLTPVDTTLAPTSNPIASATEIASTTEEPVGTVSMSVAVSVTISSVFFLVPFVFLLHCI